MLSIRKIFKFFLRLHKIYKMTSE